MSGGALCSAVGRPEAGRGATRGPVARSARRVYTSSGQRTLDAAASCSERPQVFEIPIALAHSSALIARATRRDSTRLDPTESDGMGIGRRRRT